MTNIEKSVFRKGEYVGYGGGKVWTIRKTSSYDGNWVAYSDNDRIVAFRLKDLSLRLAVLEK